MNTGADSGTVKWVAVNPPVYLLMGLLLMGVLHWRLPLFQYLNPPFSFAGVPLALGGIVVAAVGAASFARASTDLVPFSPATTLVTGGLYRYTRNPMYLGMTLMLLGMALLLGSVTALAAVAGFAQVIHKRFVLPEKAFLEKVFGQAYLDYTVRVRRCL